MSAATASHRAGPRSRWPSALAGALVGASVWISSGTLALVNAATVTRVGALPGWPWLVAALGLGAVAGAAVSLPRRSLNSCWLVVVLWLPWLPVRVPATFLMWEGPLEVAVWSAVILGVAWRFASRLDWSRLAVWGVAPRAPLVAGAISALVLIAAWAVVRPHVPAGDEPHYLVITQSLLHDGDVRIENNHQQEQYLAYFDGALKPDFMQRGVDRQIYSIHAPGVAALVLPAFAVAGYPGAVVVVAATLGAGMAAAWLAACWLTASAGAAWAAWLALLSSTPLLLHGFTIYPDPVGAAAAMAGVLALVALEGAQASRFGHGTWAGIGAALALLPWLHTRFSLVAGGLGAAIVLRLALRRGGWRIVAAFAAVPVLAAAAWFLYFWRIYGTFSPAAPYGARPENAAAFIPTGIAGLLVDQQFGVLATAPVLVVALLGTWPLWRRAPRLTLELAVVVVPYLLAVATYPMWWGGHSAPGRFAVVLLPMLALPLATWWVHGRLGRATIGILTVVSVAITVITAVHDRGAFVFNGRDGHSLLLDWLSPTVDLTLGAPSVHRDGAASAVGDALVWFAAGTIVAAAWVLSSRRWPQSTVTAALGVTAAPLVATIALPVVWAGHDRPTTSPPTSQMAFIDRWNPVARPLVLELTPTRRLDTADVPRRLSLATSERGHRAGGVAPLLQIPLVPAGDYDVFVEGATRLEGTATVRLGRQEQAMAEWALEGRPAGFPGLVLRLPATAHSITITGDDAARASVRRLSLRPRTLPDAASTAPFARAAARLGGVVLYTLDDNAFLERGAVWVRGEMATAVIVEADGAAVMRLKAGPVANVVTLRAGAWTTSVRLAADEVRDVTLPAEALSPTVLSVASGTGFRPSEQPGGSGDVRWLGVYVTFP